MNNREILFRGKRVDNEEWVEGDLRQDKDLNTVYIFGWNYSVDEGGLQREAFEYMVKPETVGQYTGLTDRNGKRIFEGDIIKGKEKATYAIRYSDATASFYAKAALPQRMLPCMTIGTMKYYAVIGNIHDNPELLSTASLPNAEDISQPVLQPATPENFELMQG